MTARIEHFVFTNLGVGISDERWLLYRLKLFKTITVPSMAAQSCQSFCWTIFIDQQFPQVFREELQDCLQRWALNVQLVEVVAYDLIQHSIKKILMDSQAELVISTRIDDDDALERTVMARIQAVAAEKGHAGGLVLVELADGIELLPRELKYRPCHHPSLALGLSLVTPHALRGKFYVNGFAHHLIRDTLAKQGYPVEEVHLNLGTPAYVYTKHQLSDSYYVGFRSRILDDKSTAALTAPVLAPFGLGLEAMAHLSQVMAEAPVGMPHKYLAKLGELRRDIRQAQAADPVDQSRLDQLNYLLHTYASRACLPNLGKRLAQGKKIRLAIVGSCVTRDLFELEPALGEQFEVVCYLARSSVISYMSLPCLDARVRVAGEGFEVRRAEQDLQKTAWEALEVSCPDLVLVDFIDERIGLIEHQGGYYSASGPVIKAFERARVDFVIRRPWDPQMVKLREWALPRFMKKLYAICPNIFIHRAQWAEAFRAEDGTVRPFAETEWAKLVELNNQVTSPMFAQLEQLPIPVESLGGLASGRMLAGGEHKWSFYPYHYDRQYYRGIARQLQARVF